jgi:small-conductance mechanosensitive channel
MYLKITPFWNQWHVVIIFTAACIGTIIAGLALHWIFKKISKKASQRKNKNIALLQKSSLIIFVLFLLYFIESLLLVPKEYSGYYSHLLALLVIVFFTWLIVQILYSVRDHIIKHAEKYSKDDINIRTIRTKLNILLKIAVFAIVIVGGAFALMTFPKIQQVGISILASAGVAGVIIGFSAQKSLGSLLAGIQIALTQPIRIDDIVVVEGEWGTVEEITLTYVAIRTWDKRNLIVPITYFVEKIFQNWTRTSFNVIGTVFLQLDHTTPIEKMRAALDNLLEKTDLWDKRVKKLDVTDSNAQTIELRILVSAINSGNLWDLRCYIREQLIGFLQREHPECLPKSRIAIKEKQ